jgi:hypothetical protein
MPQLRERAMNLQSIIEQSELAIRRDMTKREWVSLGHDLFGVAQAIPWILGDWIVFGSEAYGDKWAFAQHFKMSQENIRQLCWLARTFPVGKRHHNLTWSHHREVARLADTEREDLLTRAEAGGWTVADLRQCVRQLGALAQDAGGVVECDSVAALSARVMRWWRVTTARDDPAQWDKVRRDAIKRELEPIVEIYRNL